MKRVFTFIAIAFLLSSCAFHQGSLSSIGHNPQTHDINGLAVGTAKTTHVFGIGGLGSDALVLEAKRELYETFPLKEGQLYGNFVVDFKRSFYFIFNRTQVVISADILSPKKAASTPPIIEGPLKAGELIYVSNEKREVLEAYVLEQKAQNGSYEVFYFSNTERPKTTTVNWPRIYRSSNFNYPGNQAAHLYKIGQQVRFTLNKVERTTRTGMVKARGDAGLIVEDSGQLHVVKFWEILKE